MYFAKKIFFLIVALIALRFPHQVMAEAIITPLKDDGNFLQLLKKYGIHQIFLQHFPPMHREQRLSHLEAVVR